MYIIKMQYQSCRNNKTARENLFIFPHYDRSFWWNPKNENFGSKKLILTKVLPWSNGDRNFLANYVKWQFLLENEDYKKKWQCFVACLMDKKMASFCLQVDKIN